MADLPRSVLALTLTASSLAVPGVAHAAPARPRPTAGPCTSEARPWLAAALGERVNAALRGRTGVESVAVFDRKRGLTCSLAGKKRYDSASVVKVTVLGALLRLAQDEDRDLTERERGLAHAMITRSDNDSTTTLWKSLGMARLTAFVEQAGMKDTVLGADGYWGLTQITANDELRLLKLLTSQNTLLDGASREYALGLMNQVVPEQRWGTPAGAPAEVTWHVKNGWLPRHDKYWRVHSIGSFDGDGRDYMIVVLTRDSPTMEYGVTTIERVARAVHGTLNPGARGGVPEVEHAPIPWETSDGSVPSDV